MRHRVVVVGGDAAGMSAASQVRRRRPDVEVVALERGRWTSYSACGIPYVVGGDVDDLDDLVARTPDELRSQGIDVRMRQEAMALDLEAGTVEVRDHEHGRTYRLGYDDLVLATGARPLRPPVPGADADCVRGVQTLDDGADLLAYAEDHEVAKVAVVGGGYIGLEMAEAFVRRGRQVVVIERADEVMGTLDPDMGALVSSAMRRTGIDVRCGTETTGFSPGVVHTDAGDVAADLVVLGTGVAPESGLAVEAGIETGVAGAIVVDRRQRTSADGVWAAGDCCASFHRVSRQLVHIALGTVANKQGRVLGINLGGGYAAFAGVVGTAVTGLCGTEVGRTGLGEAKAAAAGFEVVTATVDAGTRAGYFPGVLDIRVKLVAERGSGRLLGGQIVGAEGAAKRIDVLATCVTAEVVVHDMIDLDLGYAPPFAPVWDPVLVAARQAASAVDDAR